jgi:hypothetical protein
MNSSRHRPKSRLALSQSAMDFPHVLQIAVDSRLLPSFEVGRPLFFMICRGSEIGDFFGTNKAKS